jgi:hypothetical protein
MTIADYSGVFDATSARTDLLRESLKDLENLRDEVEARIRAISDFLKQIDGPKAYPRKRDAVLRYFETTGDKPVSLSEIRDFLTREKLIAPTSKAAHALQMTLTTLVKEGQIERVRPGHYILPRTMNESQLDAFRQYSGSLPVHAHSERGGVGG